MTQSFARIRVDYATANVIREAAEKPVEAGEITAGWRRIDIRHLTYRHEPIAADAPDDGSIAQARAPSGLDQVAVSLHRGSRIALVGPSGSGKSTLMRVLAGLYDPGEIRIDIDGVPHLHLHHLGGIATVIPQEADVFAGTVRENVAFDGEVAPDVLAGVLHDSAFDEVVVDLKGGLDATLEERGANLSGGQRQRLCLARGLLAAAGSALVMLDEPTSALDPITEDKVLERIGRRFPDACLVASVHRMSLLRHFDTVVLMVAGRVMDSGTVEELLERQPMFRDMMRGQSADDDGPGSRRAA